MEFKFNVNDIKVQEELKWDISQKEIEMSPNLRQCSLDSAVLYGGSLIRNLLEQAPIKGGKKFITVDTKVTFLMPKWYPAIPGWHTDGVPRGKELLPNIRGNPVLRAQADHLELAPDYHLITVGLNSPTEFLEDILVLNIDNHNNSKLYEELTIKVNNELSKLKITKIHNTWVSWDWWNIHRAIPAEATGWRLLIRVTESNVLEPRTRDFIRTQSQVYVPSIFGW